MPRIVRACFQNHLGSTGYQPVVAGNLPDTTWTLENPVGRLPTGTGKLPVLPILKTRPSDFSGSVGVPPTEPCATDKLAVEAVEMFRESALSFCHLLPQSSGQFLFHWLFAEGCIQWRSTPPFSSNDRISWFGLALEKDFSLPFSKNSASTTGLFPSLVLISNCPIGPF